MKKLKTKKKTVTKKKLKALDLSGDDPLDQDFSNVDFGAGKWVKFSDLFEFEPKNKTITFRMSETMLDKLKLIAAKEKTDYQKLIREALAELIQKRLKNVA
ncbi:MAG: BrnA antitoxin family protein [Bdellovibrionales bacterium]|nr:BrnA antitoxin family protein [Bdellovibrionales bacterium]